LTKEVCLEIELCGKVRQSKEGVKLNREVINCKHQVGGSALWLHQEWSASVALTLSFV